MRQGNSTHVILDIDGAFINEQKLRIRAKANYIYTGRLEEGLIPKKSHKWLVFCHKI
jgi:hypothetical protein